MKFDEVHEIILFGQSKWLESCRLFNTQKRNQAINDFEKDFYKLLNNAFYGKTMKIIRNRIEVEFIEKHDTERNVKQRSKLILNDLQKSYTTYDSYTFKQNEVHMEKPIYLGFAILDLSKLLLYEVFYNEF